MTGTARQWQRAVGTPTRACVGFCVFTLAVVAAFARPLRELLRYALSNDLYSHVPLIPLVCLYVVYRRRDELGPPYRGAPLAAAAFFLAALLPSLGAHALQAALGPLAPNDVLACRMLTLILLIMGGVVLFLGPGLFRRALFPLLFLFFIMPIPSVFVDAATRFLQIGSAEASYWLIKGSGVPIYRQGFIFCLPDLTLEVARECSGIRSSFVLLVTALLAGHLFLRSPWRKLGLCAAVVPIAIVRNSLRIFLLAFLTVRVNPAVIRSGFHRHGGPPFFVLSLAALLAILVLLRRSETRRTGKAERVEGRV